MRHIIAVSGGRDSAALALYMKGRLDLVEYVFCDTGRELPEVYDFLDRLECKLGQPILRLSDVTRIDTKGKPAFDFWLESFGHFIPTPAARWCTKTLKIRPFERHIGKDDAIVYIAIRADEEGRGGNYGDRPNITYCYPLVDDGVDLVSVQRILRDAEVELPDFYRWRTVGGCWCCPFQRRRDFLGLKRHHPDLFQRALEDEKKAGHKWLRSGESLEAIAAQIELPMAVDEREIDTFDMDAPCTICAK